MLPLVVPPELVAAGTTVRPAGVGGVLALAGRRAWSVACSPDGQHVAVGRAFGTVQVFDLADERGRWVTLAHGEKDVWFATGGAKTARVLHSKDRGQNWEVSETPIGAGAESVCAAVSCSRQHRCRFALASGMI